MVEKLQELYLFYKNERDIKAFISDLTHVMINELQIENYFNGYAATDFEVEAIYYKDTKQILLNYEKMTDIAFDQAEMYGVDFDGFYNFLYSFVTYILSISFEHINQYCQFDCQKNNMSAKIYYLGEMLKEGALYINSKVIGKYINFYQENILLYPAVRSRFYFSLTSALKMLEYEEQNGIKDFLITEFYNHLMQPYDSPLAPIEKLMQSYEKEKYSSDKNENLEIKKLLLDFSVLEFYSDDKEKMKYHMLDYTVEERFRYGLPVSKDELTYMVKKLIK